MIPAEEALTLLVEGNRRFLDGVRSIEAMTSIEKRDALIAGQEPHAIILGCSDSRVPAEIIFDQGIGDLFVIRVAGNVVAPSQIESVEFAAERFGVKLVVVLGHSNCGAIAATLEELQLPLAERSANHRSIVERIRLSIETLTETDLKDKPDELLAHAVRANVRACVDHLRHGSRILEDLTDNHGLMTVGAEYSLESGLVEFFEGVPASFAQQVEPA